MAARRFAWQISDPQKNPWRDFFWASLRGIGGARRRRVAFRQWSRRAEPRKARGAEAWTVELAKEWMVEHL